MASTIQIIFGLSAIVLSIVALLALAFHLQRRPAGFLMRFMRSRHSGFAIGAIFALGLVNLMLMVGVDVKIAAVFAGLAVFILAGVGFIRAERRADGTEVAL